MIVPCSADDLKPGDDLQAALDGAGEVLRLTGGTYFIDRALRIERSDVVIEAVPGAKVVISGGRRIGGWEDRGGGRWQALVPGVAEGKWRFRELFVGGRRAMRARHPDAGTLRIAAAGEDKRTSFSFERGDLEAWPDPRGIEFVFYHDWSLSRVLMASIDVEKNLATLADPVGQTTARHYGLVRK